MIITPEKLKKWLDIKKKFTLVDTRPKNQIEQYPIKKLKYVIGSPNSIDKIKGDKILVCQFGIVTEGMILENDLQNSYSLLGGVQAWNEFIKDNNDLSRWSRQTILEEIGMNGQKKIMKAGVAIVGMGGIGCPAATSLVAAGIGTLNIIDGDTVDLSNLPRQHLYQPGDIGKEKVSVAKRFLENISSHTKINPFNNFLNQSNAKSYFDNIDIIIDATDNIVSRQFIDKVSKDSIRHSDNKVLYNFVLKKTMGKSYYSINPMPHSSLGVKSYLHATSPIRRYADLIVNYQLNRYLNNNELISKEDVEQIINEINHQGIQNIMRYREDQKYWLGIWFEKNSFNVYNVILLSWVNRYKNICILYFLEYHFSTICDLKSKKNLKNKRINLLLNQTKTSKSQI